MSVDKSKNILRKRFKHIRRSIPQALKRKYSDQTCNQILALLLRRHQKYRLPGALALYIANKNELSLQTCISELKKQHIPLCLPAIRRDGSPCFRLDTHTIEASGHGFWQPPSSSPEIIPSIVVCPLVAFDNNGARLGMGGGFYDRLLAQCTQHLTTRPLLIGAAFERQYASHSIPTMRHDIRMRYVCTEQGLRCFRLNAY